MANLKTTELTLVTRSWGIRRVLAHLFEDVFLFEDARTMPIVVDIPEPEVLSENIFYILADKTVKGFAGCIVELQQRILSKIVDLVENLLRDG